MNRELTAPRRCARHRRFAICHIAGHLDRHGTLYGYTPCAAYGGGARRRAPDL